MKTLNGYPNAYVSTVARVEEIVTFKAFSDILFKTKKVYIGDTMSVKETTDFDDVEITRNEPDIFTKDKEIGIEVTACEPILIFNKLASKYQLAFDLLQSDNNTISLQFKDNFIPKLKRAEKEFKLWSPSENEKSQMAANFYDNFCNILNKKLKNLNGGSYSGCKNVKLVIISNLAKKDFVEMHIIKQHFDEVSNDFAKQYDDVIILFNDFAYNFTTDKYLQINDDGVIEKAEKHAVSLSQ